MSTISVTALAQLAAARKLSPQYLEGLFYIQFGVRFDLWPADYCDDATVDEMAKALNGHRLQLKPRSAWCYGEPNNTPPIQYPLQNFVGFSGQTGAPNPNALLVINGGDLAQAATQGVYFMPQELYTEQALAYLIPGATMSQAAQDALASSPVAMWPRQPVYWYTPQA